MELTALLEYLDFNTIILVYRNYESLGSVCLLVEEHILTLVITMVV